MRITESQLRQIIRDEIAGGERNELKEHNIEEGMQGSLPTEDFFKGDLVETNKAIVYLKDIETGDNILEVPGRTTALFLGYLRPKGITWHQQMYEKSIVLVNGVRGWVWSSDISLVG